MKIVIFILFVLFVPPAFAQQLYVPPFNLGVVTGDFTCTGAGACTLATVASAGTIGSSTAIPIVTINVKGLTTNITTAAVIAPAGTLSGATLASGVTASSLTSLGTLTSLTTSGAVTATGTASNTFGPNDTSTGRGTVDIFGGNGAAGGGQLRFGGNAAISTYLGNASALLGGAYNTDFIIYPSGLGGATGALKIANATGNLTGYAALLLPNLATTSTAQTGTLCWATSTGNVTVDTTTTCLLSSVRFKHDIAPLDAYDSLATVMALRPVSYQYNDTTIKGRQIGFLAEDVAQLDDRLVSREPDGSPRAVRYQQLTADLAGAIQAQQKQIDELRSRRWCLAGRCW